MSGDFHPKFYTCLGSLQSQRALQCQEKHWMTNPSDYLARRMRDKIKVLPAEHYLHNSRMIHWAFNRSSSHRMECKFFVHFKHLYKTCARDFPVAKTLHSQCRGPWFLISLGLICQHSEDTYLIFWNSERDQPPHNLFHLSFRTAAHDERRFMLNECICHCPWCLDYMNMT